ncbi:hypothetical protein LCGC14_1409460 [marine sediment metagenome]|uniref:Uncharacterized protein n=2 Tax=root TaxID=1 RepID=A0A831QVR8_9FLAO|nr:hypothetical protein [Pricia sp.]HEA23481.1 hypothetical protein [Pricia antarctica]
MILFRFIVGAFFRVGYRANPNGNLSNSLTVDRAVQQQAKYREVFQTYNAIPDDNKFALTV